jgi:hypothetical protein
MPLRDHFVAPASELLPWDSLHSAWATYLASNLNEHWLPPEFQALEHTHAFGSLEIDVATYRLATERPPRHTNGPPVATATRTDTPPKVAATMPGEFPDTFEVQIFKGASLVAAIELVSPGNKDRPESRRDFAIKCASYLLRGVCVVILDVVTERRANLHNEIARLLEWKNCEMRAEASLYAAAYRPLERGKKAEIDLWTETCAVGSPLPTMPLRLTGDLFVPVEFEATYEETCRRRRLS